MAKKLSKRKVACISWCYRCKVATEDVDHILQNCNLVTKLWWDMFSWSGILLVIPRSIKDLLFCWKDGRLMSRA